MQGVFTGIRSLSSQSQPGVCGSLLGQGGADPRAPAGGPPLIRFPGESAFWGEGSADAGPLD